MGHKADRPRPRERGVAPSARDGAPAGTLARLGASWLDLLLVFFPITLILWAIRAPPIAVFGSACVAIIPLAGLMGRATESIAAHSGPGIGGFLNATFGNATEMIIALVAVKEGLYVIVKASITGSIIGNILLVLGLSMVAGGARHKHQSYNPRAASTGASMMTLAVIGLSVPAAYILVVQPDASAVVRQELSLAVCFILIVVYGCSLLFAFKTHTHLYNPEAEEEEVVTPWSRRTSLGILVATTIGVAVLSEALVSSVHDASTTLHLGELFVGVIVVAVIGNAAEHSTAILMALKNKMDLALNIATSSSTQIALFVTPVLVFASLAFATPMDLIFAPFEVLAVLMAVGIVNVVANDGESNWFEGIELLGVYGILAVVFFIHPPL